MNSVRKGWFEIPGCQVGDRTLEQQLTGLEPLWSQIAGKTVLDLGCAEGLIANECVRRGAAFVTGVDHNGQAIITAKLHQLDRQHFMQWDLHYDPKQSADIVLMLAVLHKLREPLKLFGEVLSQRPELVVVRLPPRAPVIIDRRSGNRLFNVQTFAESQGYALSEVTRGPFSEWVGWFRADN